MTHAAPLAAVESEVRSEFARVRRACGIYTKLNGCEKAAGRPVERCLREEGRACVQTAIIFDWDDTLTCTTWLQAQMSQNRKLSEEEEQFLGRLAQKSKLVLEKALRSGSHVFIITNATSGWVEESAAEWAPELLPVLSRIPIISARDRYANDFPNDAAQWKIRTFLEVQSALNANSIPVSSLVVLGDSHYEMEAACHVAANLHNAVVLKTVKFKRRPSLVELLKEVELLAEKFDRILQSPKPLNIFLTRKSALASRFLSGDAMPSDCGQDLTTQGGSCSLLLSPRAGYVS